MPKQSHISHLEIILKNTVLMRNNSIYSSNLHKANVNNSDYWFKLAWSLEEANCQSFILATASQW